MKLEGFWEVFFLRHTNPRLQICLLYIFGNKATDGAKKDLNVEYRFPGFGFHSGPNLQPCYTTWKVDGATPMYWFIMTPYKSPPFGSFAIYFHHDVYMAVSKNSGTPKSSILIGFSSIFTIHFGFFPPIFGLTPTCLGFPSSRFLRPLWFQWRWSSCFARCGSHWNLMCNLSWQHGNATSSGGTSSWSQWTLPWFGKFRLLWYTNSLDGGRQESSGPFFFGKNGGMMVGKMMETCGNSFVMVRGKNVASTNFWDVFCQYFNLTP